MEKRMLDATQSTENVNAPVYTKSQTEERRRMTDWLNDRIAASKKKPSAEVVTLTPVLAALLVEPDRNAINRPLSIGNEASLLNDVAGGRFEFNGESIVVSNTGILLDGQHRCQMVIKSGVPVQTVIVFGPKESARFTIDIGRPKTAQNFLSMKGHQYTAVLAAAARLILIYRGNDSRNIISGGSASQSLLKPTKTEVVAAVEQLRGLGESVETVHAAPKSFGSKSTLAFAHYVITKRGGRDDADHFFLKMFSGAELKNGDPILYCAKRLSELQSGGGTSGHNVRAELIFKCWNGHRRGESFTRLALNGRLPKVEK
jgi:hypothetical protein